MGDAKGWFIAVSSALALALLGCDLLLDEGGAGEASLDRRESFVTPDSYITIPEEVSRQPGLASALQGKWLAAIGTSFEVLQSSGSFSDYYRTDSRGDAELFVFYGDGSYRLDYVFNVSTGACHSSAGGAEVGTAASSADGLALTLTPSAYQATYCACSANDCSNEPADNPPRAYQLFSAEVREFSIDDTDSGRRNSAVILAGPCAPWMITMGDRDCPAGGEVIFQPVE